MDRFEPNLRIPGPTALPPSVREAGARQMINHRGPEFAAMLGRIVEGMKPFFGTGSDIAVITMYAKNHGTDCFGPWNIITPIGASRAHSTTPEDVT